MSMFDKPLLVLAVAATLGTGEASAQEIFTAKTDVIVCKSIEEVKMILGMLRSTGHISQHVDGCWRRLEGQKFMLLSDPGEYVQLSFNESGEWEEDAWTLSSDRKSVV